MALVGHEYSLVGGKAGPVPEKKGSRPGGSTRPASDTIRSAYDF